jgi:hypothetical protein
MASATKNSWELRLLGSQFKILDGENLKDWSAVYTDRGKESA